MTLRLSVLIITWLLYAPAMAALAVGTATSAEGTTSTSHSHTFGASDNLAIICVGQKETGGAVTTNSSVTVGGNNATFLDGRSQGGVMRSEIWYYLSPPTGSQTIAVTAATGTDYTITGVIPISGAAQTGTFGTVVLNGSNAATDADLDTIGSALGELGVLCGAVRDNNATVSPDATAPVSVEAFEDPNSGSASSLVGFGYTEAGDTPSINMRVDFSLSKQYAAAAVSIRPAASTVDFFGRRR